MFRSSNSLLQFTRKSSGFHLQIREFCAIKNIFKREKNPNLNQGQAAHRTLANSQNLPSTPHVFSRYRSFSPVIVRQFSRFSANTIMTGTDVFKISDYDCIGFDLDNTLVRYNISNMVKLEYELLAKYLVEEKGHSKEFLYKPYDDAVDFLQKGLILDFHRGNQLRIGPDGYIQKAAHGTTMMTDAEIVADYGEDRKWEVTTEYSGNMSVAWEGQLAARMRTLLDYFDMPSALAFGRIVDGMDHKAQKKVGAYDFWDDIFNGLVNMYTRENFQTEVGGFFKELKQHPDKYVHKTNKAVMSWLKEMRKTKTTFLMTGSYLDFANFTASTAMGADWRDYFDFIVVFAKKPGFFTGARPFVRIENNKEMEALKQEDLEVNGIYSQGNWRDMLPVLAKHCGKPKPKFLYIGDNLIQDIYTPNKYTKCDTIAIAEEMIGEGMKDHPELHPDSKLLYSNTWGSYFSQDDEPSIWADVIRKYSKICVPSVEILAHYPLDYEFNCFTESESSKGFYPNEPLFVVK